jgi:hypothetical protein
LRVAAVVVNWNGGEDNLRCLESLLAQGPALERILFVDNASSDGSPERVSERFPGVEVLRNEANVGYGAGNNRGIEAALEAGAEAVLVVNNDVTLPPGTVAALVEALEAAPGAGLVGPRVLYRDRPERVWAAGGRLTWRENLTTLIGHGAPDGEAFRRTLAVDYVPGCALLARREVFEAVGPFDADYFAYTEDVDLGLRASRAGFGSLCAGGALAYHAPSSSTGGGYNPRRKYMMGVNSIWFLRRWAGPGAWLRFLVFDVATLPFAWIAGLFSGRAKAVLAKGVGIAHGLLGRRITSEVVESGGWLW